MDFVKALVEVDAKQDEIDHEAEMAQVDKQAEEDVKKHQEEGDDSNLAAIEAEINAEEAKAADVKDCKIEPKKNVDSSDEECACAGPKLTEKDKSKVKAKQVKKAADAKAAKAAAEKAKEAAEEAIAAANLAKRTSAKNVLELAKKAETAIADATSAEHKKIKKVSEAKMKVSLVKSEKFDLRVKLAVKNWEETVVNKHELWETYKSIKKNYRIAVTNVKLVRQNVKAAENKLI
jgi:colicin import membrane protein